MDRAKKEAELSDGSATVGRVEPTISPTSPLRLKEAARLAFPDGSMSVSALRRCGVSGLLTVEKIAGKDYTTLADIEEMKKRCRVQAKARESPSKGEGPELSGTSGTVTELGTGCAEGDRAALKENLRNTSQASTTPGRAGATVIPMRSK